jgi:hypothetical protein
VLNHYGRGEALYAAGALESSDVTREVFANLVRLLAAPFTAEAVAPKPVEMTVRHDVEGSRFLISLVNFQKDLPNIPVDGIRVRFRPGQRQVQGLTLLPDGEPWPYETADGAVEFTAPKLATLRMFALHYTD